MSHSLSDYQINNINNLHLFSLEKKIRDDQFTIEDVGDYLPGNILVTDLNSLSTVYMNKSGCNILKHSAEELKELGPEYFQKFFVPEEMGVFVPTYLKMQQEQDASHIYNFTHRVKTMKDGTYRWYFASAKLMYDADKKNADKMLLVVNEVSSLGNISAKINSVLDEGNWMRKNFEKLAILSKREKEVIGLLALGKTNADISDMFSISKLTVNTHRRNIKHKLKFKTFADLHRFAIAFDLISTLKQMIVVLGLFLPSGFFAAASAFDEMA